MTVRLGDEVKFTAKSFGKNLGVIFATIRQCTHRKFS